MAVETIETYGAIRMLSGSENAYNRTVSLSTRRIFIFDDEDPALSVAETILEMYPDIACTTSIAERTREGSLLQARNDFRELERKAAWRCHRSHLAKGLT